MEKIQLLGTLCCITGDNLGSHSIAGFCENFSTVSYFCRYCLITLAEFRKNPYHVGPLRTKESYESALKSLENTDVRNVKEVKFDSEFNNLN